MATLRIALCTGEFPGWAKRFGLKPQARGFTLWGSIGEGKEIALIGPAVTLALKAQAFSPGFYLIVPAPLSGTCIPLRWLRAFSRQTRGSELTVSFPLKHTHLHMKNTLILSFAHTHLTPIYPIYILSHLCYSVLYTTKNNKKSLWEHIPSPKMYSHWNLCM